MPPTYNPNLVSDLDWVRFLSGDSYIANAQVSDEEINALLTAEDINGTTSPARRYFVAATILSTLHTRWISVSKGLLEKETGKLRIRWGVESASVNIEERIKELREIGARLLSPSPYSFKILS